MLTGESDYLLLATCYLLLTTYYWLLTTYYVLLTQVTLTALTGDPDLYIDNRQHYPTHQNHGWRATHMGDDVVSGK